jgi:hypothetical protein
MPLSMKVMKRLSAINLSAVHGKTLHTKLLFGFFLTEGEAQNYGLRASRSEFPVNEGFDDHRAFCAMLPVDLLLDSVSDSRGEGLYFATWVDDEENELVRRMKNLVRSLSGEAPVPRREVVRTGYCVAPSASHAAYLLRETFGIFDSIPSIGEVRPETIDFAYAEIVEALNRAFRR